MSQTRVAERLVKYTYLGITSKKYATLLEVLQDGRKLVEDETGAEEYWLDATSILVNQLEEINTIDSKLSQVLIKNIKNKQLDYIVIYL